MRSRNAFYAPSGTTAETRHKIDDRDTREFWRKLARMIILFDEASPANILADKHRGIP
jgi:hypothetical protein